MSGCIWKKWRRLMNNEHYKDTTADQAISNANRDKQTEVRIERVLKHFRYICKLEGLLIVDRIHFKDIYTGKEYQ